MKLLLAETIHKTCSYECVTGFVCIVYSLGNTLWCDPIVKRQFLSVFNMWVPLWYASQRLIGDVNAGHIAVHNPQVSSLFVWRY